MVDQIAVLSFYQNSSNTDIVTESLEGGSLQELLIIYKALVRDIAQLRSCATQGDIHTDPQRQVSQSGLKVSLRPSEAARRHRATVALVSAGLFHDSSACRGYSTEELEKMTSEYQRRSDRLFQLIEEVEQAIIEAAPQSRTEAKLKAQLLLTLLKEDGAYDVDMLAFAVEECLEHL